MGLLDGKVGLVFGVANDHSIAWGIAQALHREGAELGFSYAGEMLERRVRPLAESLGARLIEPCDVASDEQIVRVFERAREVYSGIDILIHSVAYAPREALSGQFLDTSRENFRICLDISCYSFVAMAREAAKLMEGRNGSMLTLTYYAAEKAVPRYNIMGVAKAALEATVRYLAMDLGPRGIRVNAISAGPVRTLSAMGVAGFRQMAAQFPSFAPLRRHITLEELGNTAVFLCSDMSSGTTGEVLFVDAGFNVVAFPEIDGGRQTADGGS
jgi:enoyl-[acyl-carrier protein] reductase I